MKVVFQHDKMDCGPACLAMLANYHGKSYTLSSLRRNSFISKEGVSLLGISEAATTIGFKTYPMKTSLSQVNNLKTNLPAILHWNQNHFVVLCKISKRTFSKKTVFHIADPSYGLITLDEEKIKKAWLSDGDKGIVLFLQPTEDFYKQGESQPPKLSFLKLATYLTPFKKEVVKMGLMMLLGSVITLALPFLTQLLIDRGIGKKDYNFIVAILLAQLALNLGSAALEMVRNWFALYVGSHISINIISDFFNKILRLPLKFFDTKLIGDFNQRIQDNERIESFLTSQGLLTCFSLVTFCVYFVVLCYYDIRILSIFSLLTILSITWSFYWLKKRSRLDYFRFKQRAENQESVFEILNGVTEMKLNAFEKFKLREWQNVQKDLYRINIKMLRLNQFQVSGYELLNQTKNILVTFVAANLVIQNKMTLGQLLSVSFIIGQINSPISQLVGFFRTYQDAKLSLERLNDVQNQPDEDYLINQEEEEKLKNIAGEGILLRNVSFQYKGPKSVFVLKNITTSIRHGKVTAIVGASGSGKTTLMKLLLKFYDPTAGKILLEGQPLEAISNSWLRKHSGIVMQDGFIFGDSIERNIICGDEVADRKRLTEALSIANLNGFIQSLPLGLNTKIGMSGNGISGGQKQRILIARAVYKNPDFIFLDEATSALDAENERIIHDNLQSFFKGKTVIIIAHRLSTVKNADQILVLKEGEIIEAGTHTQLVSLRSAYFNLVKNQLELGN